MGSASTNCMAAAGLDSRVSRVKPQNRSLLQWHCTLAAAGEDSALPRVKPFKYTYEKEIVMYAYFKKLDYFSTECVYAPFAARGFARDFIKDLEVGTADAACLRSRAAVMLCRQLLLQSSCCMAACGCVAGGALGQHEASAREIPVRLCCVAALEAA